MKVKLQKEKVTVCNYCAVVKQSNNNSISWSVLYCFSPLLGCLQYDMGVEVIEIDNFTAQWYILKSWQPLK